MKVKVYGGKSTALILAIIGILMIWLAMRPGPHEYNATVNGMILNIKLIIVRSSQYVGK